MKDSYTPEHLEVRKRIAEARRISKSNKLKPGRKRPKRHAREVVQVNVRMKEKDRRQLAWISRQRLGEQDSTKMMILLILEESDRLRKANDLKKLQSSAYE